MNDSVPSVKTRSPRSAHRKRWGARLQFMLQFLLVVVLLGLVQYLGWRHYRLADLSGQGFYTLSEQTRRVLSELDSEVRMVVCFSRRSENYSEIIELADLYEREGGENFILEVIDPQLDSDRAIALSGQYDISLEGNHILVTSEQNAVMIAEKDMLDFEQAIASGQSRVFYALAHAEEKTTAAILAITQEQRQKIYYLRGHGQPALDDHLALSELRRELELQYAALEIWDFAKEKTLPDDAAAFLSVGASRDFSAVELGLLRSYWEDKRGSLCFILDPESMTPRVWGFLDMIGVRVQPDRVISVNPQRFHSPVRFGAEAIVLPGSPLTENMAGLTLTLKGQISSLRVMQNDGYLLAENVRPVPLLLAEEGYWGETRYREIAEAGAQFDPQEDFGNPLYLAAAVEKGAVDDERLRVETSRLIAIGHHFYSSATPTLAPGLNQFVLSALNWLTDRETFLGIAPRRASLYTLQITEKQRIQINQVISLLLPGVAFLLALIVRQWRKSGS